MTFPRRSRVALVLAAVLLSGCYALRESDGGGMTDFAPPRVFDPADVALPAGYRIELAADGLTFPTGVAFDDAGGVYVVEAGYSYGEVFTTPRLLRIGPDGGTTVVAAGTDNGPWTGAAWHDGAFYVSEGGQLRGGRILRVTPDGGITVLADDLPSLGDHHTNGVRVGPDGWLYFGQGTATNAAVVGPDNADFGWLHRYPQFHDVPCRDVTLTGASYTSPNPLAEGDGEPVVTGPYLPFGTPARAGQVVPGAIPCNGAIFRLNPQGGPVELVAWGFRNPFGLAFAPSGTLYAVDHGYDQRGSRPVFGAGDQLWAVEPGAWYGWPDFHGGTPLVEGDRYKPPGESAPEPLLADPPGVPPRPAAQLGVHAGASGADVSRNPAFGHVGEVFIAEFGDQTPAVGKVWAPVGYQVVRVDPATGVVTSFAANRGEDGGPASYTGGGGLERPVAVRFDPVGTALYVVDFGVMTMSEAGANPWPGTGALWRIVPDAVAAAGGTGGTRP